MDSIVPTSSSNLYWQIQSEETGYYSPLLLQILYSINMPYDAVLLSSSRLLFFFKLCDLWEHSKRHLSDLVCKFRKKQNKTKKPKQHKKQHFHLKKINKYSIQNTRRTRHYILYNNNASRDILCMVHRDTVNTRNNVTPVRDG